MHQKTHVQTANTTGVSLLNSLTGQIGQGDYWRNSQPHQYTSVSSQQFQLALGQQCRAILTFSMSSQITLCKL